MKFWSWLKSYAERKERESWIEIHGCDQKCPACETWQGNCGGWTLSRPVDPSLPDTYLKCGKCGSWSQWIFEGPIAVLIAQSRPSR